ncbi:hypothetical protein [Bythopirellula polymerisocia]|uniref:Uncharacterized protein n=1 Tax=Bythopirellula polymerisocia TaxID=2528003 RepID=A0A5C6CT84_9BACT|nr:hypothetical protein [Bythopirellula polymerisocia]TWU27598.1 hypothetical protein Pla144_23750 [Bythopirellula polymerisocia]
MMNDAEQKRQRLLPFEDLREAQRQERVERILGKTPRLTTGARLIDETSYREATESNHLPNHNIEGISDVLDI